MGEVHRDVRRGEWRDEAPEGEREVGYREPGAHVAHERAQDELHEDEAGGEGGEACEPG